MDRRKKLLLLASLFVSEGQLLIVSGVSPLSIANALAKNIVSLTQYGKCEQDGTPTSVTPVDIKCNNGTLTMVDDELPSGYKRITSIKFDGDFWYELEEALTGDDDVTMTLDDTLSSGQNVFGSYNGTASGKKNFSLYIYGGISTNSSYLRYGEQLVRPKLGSGERTITFGKSGTSGFQTDAAITPEEFTTPANAYIGMLPNSSSPAYTGSIIGNVLVGTRLKYIPCEREHDGVIGYYEAVNGAFLEPIGTGTPVAGSYDTSHLNKLTVVGTPEVLTVSDANLLNQQTASAVNLLAVGDTKDEQDIISGVVTRRCAMCYYDGTQPVGDTYLSTTGGKDVGAIIVYPLATPTTETVAAQPLTTTEGANIVSVVAEVSNIPLSITYKGTT